MAVGKHGIQPIDLTACRRGIAEKDLIGGNAGSQSR